MVLASITALLLLASAPAPAAAAPVASAMADEAIPASVFVTEKPKDAKELKDVKASAQKGDIKKGDTVTVQGRIGGRTAPFVPGRAIFILADGRLVACSERSGDKCKTPWDFCCETPDSLKANTATVQIVGADGKPLKVTAEKSGGLATLSRLVVVGTVAEISKEGAFVINATKIYVEK